MPLVLVFWSHTSTLTIANFPSQKRLALVETTMAGAPFVRSMPAAPEEADAH